MIVKQHTFQIIIIFIKVMHLRSLFHFRLTGFTHYVLC
nr:MAG TPA: hypothetical protein [Caudoviricetes sp.]